MYSIAYALPGEFSGTASGNWDFDAPGRDNSFEDVDEALEMISALGTLGCEWRGLWAVFDEDGHLEEKRDTSCEHNH